MFKTKIKIDLIAYTQIIENTSEDLKYLINDIKYIRYRGSAGKESKIL